MKKLLCLGVFAFIFLFFYREEESGVRSEVNSNISQCWVPYLLGVSPNELGYSPIETNIA